MEIEKKKKDGAVAVAQAHSESKLEKIQSL